MSTAPGREAVYTHLRAGGVLKVTRCYGLAELLVGAQLLKGDAGVQEALRGRLRLRRRRRRDCRAQRDRAAVRCLRGAEQVGRGGSGRKRASGVAAARRHGASVLA